MQSESFRNYFWLLLDAFLVAAIVGLLFFALPLAKKFGDSLYPVRSMTVTAEGKTLVSPDIATTYFSVISRGVDPQKLAQANNQLINEAIDFVKSKGVGVNDIRTTAYDLQPTYEYDENRRTSFISGYTMTQTVTLKIRDLAKVGEILGGLPELGINHIGGVSFGVDEPEKYLAEAREEALRRAQEKAAAMAKASGVKLGRILSVNEYQPGPVYPYAYAAKSVEGMGGGVAPPASPTIEPGSEEVTVRVMVNYELR